MASEDKNTQAQVGSLLVAIGLILFVAFFSYVISLFDFFQQLELKISDQHFQLRGPRDVENSDIVIVAIDEHTTDSLKFPFDRRLYAEAIKKLNRLGAKQIVFDIQYSSQGINAESDSIFYAAIENAGNVVLVGKVDRKIVKGLREPIPEIKPPFKTVNPPNTPMGIADELIDADGVTRKYTLFVYDKERKVMYLSLGLKAHSVRMGFEGEVAEFSRTEDFRYGDLSIPRYHANSTLLNYYGPANTFPTYSFLDVVRGNYDFDDMLGDLSAEEIELLVASGMMDMFEDSPFKDKVILIGASAADLQDNKFTPFFSAEYNRLTPGVEVHANAMQMFADGEYIRTVPISWTWLCVLLMSIAMLLIVRFMGQYLGMAVTGILAIGMYAIAFALFKSQGLWFREMPILLAIVTGYPTNLIYQYVQSQKEKAMIRGMFAQYVPRKVTDALIENPDLMKLGGEKRRMTMLFTDVAGFTSVSEKLSPEDLVALLNDYLSPLTEIILEHDGIIDKYEGDLIMAEWGAPLWFEDHAIKGCKAGLNMQKKLAELRKVWHEEGRPELYSRVGINTGDVIVGNMGSVQVFDYTVMGDAVNLSSRLEGANKNYGTTIMIGQNTYEEVKDHFVTRPLDLIRVKGKTEPVNVYELLAETEKELTEEKLRALVYFKDALDLYRKREFAAALKVFENALRVEPTDSPSEVYAERCKNFIENPPPEDWEGVETLTEK